MDALKTLAFLTLLSEQALSQARAGDMELLERIGANVAMKHYFDNVHGTKAIKPDSWAQAYNPYLQQADALREAYEKDAASVDRVSALEAKLEALSAQITQLLEAQDTVTDAPVVTTPMDAPPPASPRKVKPAAAVKVETPAEAGDAGTETAADGETDET